MKITSIFVRLEEDGSQSKKVQVLAYFAVVFDNALRVNDLKLLKTPDKLFVEMPLKRPRVVCPACPAKNMANARYCERCGTLIRKRSSRTRSRNCWSICCPISDKMRQEIETALIEAYRVELNASKQAGYVSSFDRQLRNMR